MFSRESERLRHHAQARAPLIDVRAMFWEKDDSFFCGRGKAFFILRKGKLEE